MKKILIATILTAGATLSSTAMAGALNTAPITQTFAFNTLDASTDLIYDGFDSALGTLHSVHITYTMDKTLNNDIINVNATPSTIGVPSPVSATSQTTFQLTAVGSATVLASDVNNLTTPDFTGTVPGGGAITTVGTASATNLTNTISICDDGSCLGSGGIAVTSAVLASFIDGTNVLNINIANQGVQGGSVPSGVFTGNTGSVNGSVDVVYDYDAINVPEPTSIALLGLGLTFAGLRKRKQA
jgi:hypothetical protein